MSLRKAINAKCKSCAYDSCAAGSWRQQTTMCSVTVCPLWPQRPRTAAKIPDSVLRHHGIDPNEFKHDSNSPIQAPLYLSGSSCEVKTAAFEG